MNCLCSSTKYKRSTRGPKPSWSKGYSIIVSVRYPAHFVLSSRGTCTRVIFIQNLFNGAEQKMFSLRMGRPVYILNIWNRARCKQIAISNSSWPRKNLGHFFAYMERPQACSQVRAFQQMPTFHSFMQRNTSLCGIASFQMKYPCTLWSTGTTRLPRQWNQGTKATRTYDL